MERNIDFSPEMNQINDYSNDIRLQSGGTVVSLWFQMCLYFNSYFTPIWMICQILSLNLKFNKLSEIHAFMASISLVILIIIELPRLYLGYFGNLGEKVRHLLAFVLLSVLIQFPIHLFRQMSPFFGILVTPFELIIDLIEFIFLLIEIILSINTLSKSTKYQLSEFNKNQ